MKNTIIIAVMLIAGAAVHGAVTQRWSVFGADSGHTQRVHDLDVTYGDCVATKIENDVPTKERSIATSKRYLSTAMNFAASTSIISGVPGSVATHTPDVCYTSSGFTMKSSPKKQTVTMPDGKVATYLVADFEKSKATQTERVRVRWAWYAKGQWDVPSYARFQYMSTPELFKLYVVTSLPTDETPGEETPTVQGFVTAAFVQYSEAISR
ncbi:hypothetical protein BH11PLA2_BH11PLA2_30370 [soil metagenome]